MKNIDPKECKHMSKWRSCKIKSEPCGDMVWETSCYYFPQCSDCPDFTPKDEDK